MESLFRILSLIVLIISIPTLVRGYAKGAPTSDAVCSGMTPGHNGLKPQTKSNPYTLELGSTEVKLGELVKLRLSAPRDKIKGFMVQARKVNSSSGNNINNKNRNQQEGALLPIGSFFHERGYEKAVQFVKCGRSGFQNTATHIDPSEKDQVKLVWKAPMESGTYVILFSVVKNLKTFWVGQQSKRIVVKGSMC